jgi:hypothetical protein
MAMLYKHRDFFGEKWFEYHMAGTLLAYIGSRPNKMQSISYAVKRCGVIPVVASLIDTINKKLKRFVWTWQQLILGSDATRRRIRRSAGH